MSLLVHAVEPGIVAPLAAGAGVLGLGVARLWRSAGRWRVVGRRELIALLVGWLALVGALLSPLHQLGEVLFAAHMAQHELLMAVAAPLLVLGRPIVPLLWGLPASWRRGLGSWAARPSVRSVWHGLTHPVVAWTLQALAIWVWHLPALYEATLRHEGVHALQHVSFLGSALLFWWTVLEGPRGRLGRPSAVLSLFTTAMHTSILGALLTFSSVVWYPIYHGGAYGLTPLEDQQLAGLIMWIPGGVAYLVAALALVASWLREDDHARVGRIAGAASLLLLLVAAGGLAGCDRSGALSAQQAAHLTGGGDAAHGAEAIRRFGCGACHVIPGIPGAQGQVGPPLGGVGGRAYLAGVLTNTPEHMVRWIVNPRGVDSLTAMPSVGVGPDEARDIAAYLYTRR